VYEHDSLIKFRNLQRGSDSVTVYNDKFQKLIFQILELQEKVQIHFFPVGLNPKLVNFISTQKANMDTAAHVVAAALCQGEIGKRQNSKSQQFKLSLQLKKSQKKPTKEMSHITCQNFETKGHYDNQFQQVLEFKN
jgi:hypothetical protein